MVSWYSVVPEDLNIESTRADTIQFLSRVRRYRTVEKRIAERGDKVTATDLFTMLFKPDVNWKDNSPNPLLAAWEQAFTESDVYKDLRKTTVRSVGLSTIVSVKLLEDYLRHKDETMAKAKAVQSTKEVAVDMIPQSPEMATRMLDMIKSGEQDAVKEIQEDGLDYRDESFMLDAAEAAAGTVSMIETFSELDGGTGGKMAGSEAVVHKQMEMAFDERIMGKITNQDQFRRIARMMGRWRRIREKVKSETISLKKIPKRVTQGDSLERVIPSELGLLRNSLTKRLFYKKMIDRSLLMYDSNDEEPEGKGPVISLIDTSGSMYGKPLHVALSLSLELAKVALEENRSFWAIPFNGGGLEPVQITDSSSAIGFVSKWLGKARGGTNFYAAIKSAMEVCADEKNADITLITDGYCHVNKNSLDEIAKWKSDSKTRMFGLNVAGYEDSWQKDFEKLLDVTACANAYSDNEMDTQIEVVLQKVLT